ncbi:MAG: permease [Chloroflexota bacterium]
MQPSETKDGDYRQALLRALKSSGRQFSALLPFLVGVVLLIGLLRAFISQQLVASILTGNTVIDTLIGACFGSIVAGNPINSYVLGGELLKYGVSLFAVTALIVAWVSVGVVQLPAEMAALGRRFALVRVALSFVAAIAIALVTVIAFNLVGMR